METLQELVAQRRGYKFLSADGTSPYQHHKYDLKNRRIMMTKLNASATENCGEGWNLATLKWIGDNCLKLDGIIIECSIPKTAQICVPNNSDGKFRTDKIKIEKIHRIDSAFPLLENIKNRLKDYTPVNPFTAEEMPEPNKIKKIMDQVGTQVGSQVGPQVWDQIGPQVFDQIGPQVWDQVWTQVGDQVWAQVGGDQVGGDQVGSQVGTQVGTCAYKAIADFFNLDYDLPAFELIRLGIMVVNVLGKLKVFGKGGKYLGEV